MEPRIITVLDPTATPHPVRREIAERPAQLGGLTLVFVSNSKPNVAAFYDALEPALRERLGEIAVQRESKASASVPLARDRLDDIGRTCAGAVVAICD